MRATKSRKGGKVQPMGNVIVTLRDRSTHKKAKAKTKQARRKSIVLGQVEYNPRMRNSSVLLSERDDTKGYVDVFKKVEPSSKRELESSSSSSSSGSGSGSGSSSSSTSRSCPSVSSTPSSLSPVEAGLSTSSSAHPEKK